MNPSDFSFRSKNEIIKGKKRDKRTRKLNKKINQVKSNQSKTASHSLRFPLSTTSSPFTHPCNPYPPTTHTPYPTLISSPPLILCHLPQTLNEYTRRSRVWLDFRNFVHNYVTSRSFPASLLLFHTFEHRFVFPLTQL